MVMKKIILFFFLLLSFQSFSQEKKHTLKVGFQMGNTAHLGASAYGYHVAYDYVLFDRYSVSIGYGQLHGDDTQTGSSKGTIGGVAWDNSYELYSSEGYNYIELNALYAYVNNWNFLNLKLGGGITFLSNGYNYNKNVEIARGIVVNKDETRHVENLSMINFVLDNDFKLTDDFFINWKLIVRRPINEQKPLDTTTTFGGGVFSGSTSQIDFLGAMVIGVGYRF